MSTNPTTDQNETSENPFVATLPEWKKALWHDISLAAQDKGTFEEDDYDKNGDLNPRFAKFEELCTWLNARRRKAQFETVMPAWRSVPHGRWELIFYAVDDTATSSAGEQNHIYRKTTGIYVGGLIPAEQIREDWVLIRSDTIPSQEELVIDKEGYCYIM